MQKIFKKWLKWFVVFMKFVVPIKHYDSLWLGYVCEPCEKFDNYHIISGCF
jgi:membrane protein DedA with SNARE-associated domain